MSTRKIAARTRRTFCHLLGLPQGSTVVMFGATSVTMRDRGFVRPKDIERIMRVTGRWREAVKLTRVHDSQIVEAHTPPVWNAGSQRVFDTLMSFVGHPNTPDVHAAMSTAYALTRHKFDSDLVFPHQFAGDEMRIIGNPFAPPPWKHHMPKPTAVPCPHPRHGVDCPACKLFANAPSTAQEKARR